MFSAIRSRATYANVTMTLALVFAMTGGAYAAKKYLITSTKQISPSVLKALAGKPGSAGPAGPAGANGKDGLNGVNGKDGAPGLEGKEGPQGKEGKLGIQGLEGKEGKQGIQGIEGKEGKEGKEGSPWVAGGTLPSGKTETGAFAIEGPEGKFLTGGISFPIPLTTAPTPLKPGEAEYTSKCTGTSEQPTAAAGYFCVYPTFGNVEGIFNPASGISGAVGTTGAGLRVENSEFNVTFGTFAVTAP